MNNGAERVNDQDLARQAVQGDRAAFGALVRRHQRSVYNVAYRLLGRRRDAEDATQETFLRAYRAFHRFDVDRPLAPWLKRIAVNVCLNRLEAERVRPALSATDIGGPEATGDLDQWAAEAPNPEQALVAVETAAQVWAAILALPPHYRAVIELRHFQALSYEAIAAALDRPLSSIKSDLFRARRRLAQLLSGAMEP